MGKKHLAPSSSGIKQGSNLKPPQGTESSSNMEKPESAAKGARDSDINNQRSLSIEEVPADSETTTSTSSSAKLSDDEIRYLNSSKNQGIRN